MWPDSVRIGSTLGDFAQMAKLGGNGVSAEELLTVEVPNPQGTVGYRGKACVLPAHSLPKITATNGTVLLHC